MHRSANDNFHQKYVFCDFAVSDPARFSCGVTGEEIKVSGVVVYDECFVNSKNMMNKVG